MADNDNTKEGNAGAYSGLFNAVMQKEELVIIIGAGCSIESHIPSFNELKRCILLASRQNILSQPASKSTEVNLDEFDRLWDELGPITRHNLLENWILHRSTKSTSYNLLALMAKAGIINTFVTYNIDSFLENAFHSIGMDDFVVMINKCHTQEKIAEMIQDKNRTVILKTHGDHKHSTYALSRKEMALCGEVLRPIMEMITRRKLVIIGYSAQDMDFMRSLSLAGTGEEIWFVNPSEPPADLRTVMDLRHSGNNWIKETFSEFVTHFFAGIQHITKPDKLKRERFRWERHYAESEAEAIVLNRFGLHARPSAALVQLCSQFSCEIFFIRRGLEDRIANGKSIISLMVLAAECGAKILIRCCGEDQKEAMTAILNLFANKFNCEDIDNEDLVKEIGPQVNILSSKRTDSGKAEVARESKGN